MEQNKHSATIHYFEKSSPAHTLDTIESVKRRLGQADLSKVIVPVTSGKTFNEFKKHFDERQLIRVSEEEAISVCKLIIKKESFFDKLVSDRTDDIFKNIYKRREMFDAVFLPFCGENNDAARDILYAFGHGMKVAVQITLVAVEKDYISSGERVIAVGGLEGGVDTGVVIKAATRNQAFKLDSPKRLEIEEVVCMPKKK